MTVSNGQRSLLARKYFRPPPNKPSYLLSAFLALVGLGSIGFALLFGIIGLMRDGDSVLFCYGTLIAGFGLLGILAGGYSYDVVMNTYKQAFADAEPKPSDIQMDKWLEEDKYKIALLAFKNLDLVQERVLNRNDPLIVIGPKTPTTVAQGRDGILRCSKYEVVVIYLTDYQLASYSCELDFITGQVFMGQTQEYHYTDVVSVSTYIENSPFEVVHQDGQKLYFANHQQFALSVANGDRIKVTVSFPLEGILKPSKLQPSGAEKTIAALRAVLRKKKGGVQDSKGNGRPK